MHEDFSLDGLATPLGQGFVCFLVGLGFKFSFELAKQALYCLSYTSSPFCSGYFGK
jgi:hypothetical protein